MSNELSISDIDLGLWDVLIRKGISNAITGLSQMVQKNIEVNSVNIKKIQAKEIPGILGGPETRIIGIYLTFSGDAHGHIMMTQDPEVAYALLGMLLGDSPVKKDTFSDMEESALGEIGNITGTFFLNAIANALSVTLYPSPPAVLVDMPGAILDIALAEILQESDDVLIVDTIFTTDDGITKGRFLIMPNKSLLELPQKVRN